MKNLREGGPVEGSRQRDKERGKAREGKRERERERETERERDRERGFSGSNVGVQGRRALLFLTDHSRKPGHGTTIRGSEWGCIGVTAPNLFSPTSVQAKLRVSAHPESLAPLPRLIRPRRQWTNFN